jgi:hypothetical protein
VQTIPFLTSSSERAVLELFVLVDGVEEQAVNKPMVDAATNAANL